MDIKYGRKRRGIHRECKEKIEDWINSLDNPELQQIAKKSVILTGGAIASMAMGDSVNDFDLYFRDINSAVAIANYYVEKFNQRHKVKVATGVSPYTPVVRVEEIENIKHQTESRVVIYIKSAGVVSEEQDAYNYFERLGPDDLADFMESLKPAEGEELPPYRPTFLSQNAITLSNSVQLITRFYGEPDAIHSNYDFVHAKCYYDYHKDILVMPAESLEAMMSRTLIYQGSLYPIASIFRMKKFLERGWRISAGQQLKIMWQISEINLKEQEVLRDQLTGVDMAYLYQVIVALHDVDPEKINSTYVAEIIDRIFD